MKHPSNEKPQKIQNSQKNKEFYEYENASSPIKMRRHLNDSGNSRVNLNNKNLHYEVESSRSISKLEHKKPYSRSSIPLKNIYKSHWNSPFSDLDYIEGDEYYNYYDYRSDDEGDDRYYYDDYHTPHEDCQKYQNLSDGFLSKKMNSRNSRLLNNKPPALGHSSTRRKENQSRKYLRNFTENGGTIEDEYQYSYPSESAHLNKGGITHKAK